MKPKFLLLLKFLGYSFVLYFLGHNLFHQYASAMTDFLNVEDPRYNLSTPTIQAFLYSPSMTVIAFIALTLATPKITMLKKAYIIFVGIVVFVLTDFIFIQYFKGESSLREDSDVFKVYLCIKLLLPFLLWILPNYSHLGGFLAASNKNSKELSDNQFPAK